MFLHLCSEDSGLVQKGRA